LARLFVAIELSKKQKQEVYSLQQKLREYLEGVRWVRPEGLHLTLKFLGETDLSWIEPIKKAMDRAAADTSSIKIIYGSSGVFPSPKKARVLWIGLREGAEALQSLAENLDQILAKSGFMPEKRKFHPHLTIGRLRSSVPEKMIRRFLEEESNFQTTMLDAKQAVLFESRLHPDGALYTPLYKVEFVRGQNKQI